MKNKNGQEALEFKVDWRTIAEAWAKEVERDMSEWISVEVRLPDNNFQNVLFYGQGFDVLEGKVRGETCIGYYRNGFRFDGKNESTVRGVTHWMPLPEPPK